MKKLLVLLILTLGISQTKLETRVYSLGNIYFPYGIEQEIDLDQIVGFQLDNALISLYSASTDETNQINRTIQLKTTSENGFGDDIIDIDLRVNGFDIDTNGGRAEILIYNTERSLKAIGQGINGSTTYDFYAELQVSITAQFPDMDTGYIEEGFDFCLSPGANLVSYPCDNPVPVGQALPGGAENFISSIIGQGQATQYNSSAGWVGSLSSFNAGSGYWFIANSDVCFQYECVAN